MFYRGGMSRGGMRGGPMMGRGAMRGRGYPMPMYRMPVSSKMDAVVLGETCRDSSLVLEWSAWSRQVSLAFSK